MRRTKDTLFIKTDTFYFYNDERMHRNEIYYIFGIDEPSDTIYYYIFSIPNANTPDGFPNDGQTGFSGACRRAQTAESFSHDIEIGKIEELSHEEVLEKLNHSPIVRVLKNILLTEN